MMRLRKRTRGFAAVAGAAAVLAAWGAVGSAQGGEGGGDREARYKSIIADPTPKPADVIWAAGAPDGVARAGDGSLLLTYFAGNVEDDEGPAASAWRITDPDGRTVAQRAVHTDMESTPDRFKGVSDGFVRVPPGEGADGAYALDLSGKRHKVTVSQTALGTRPGDIMLNEVEPTLIYRPASRTVAAPAGVPDYGVRLAVDERGTAWSLDQPLSEDPNRVVWQREGSTLGSQPVPSPYAGGLLAAKGGTAAVLLDSDEGAGGLMVTADRGKTWRTVTGGGVPWQELKQETGLLVLKARSDGRLVVGEEGGRYWLADDRTNTSFHEVEAPAKFTSFDVHGNTLYGIVDATTATYDLVKGEGLWASRDDGRTWKRVAKP
ncbi:hypothetical protein G5C51_40025 [Streptomyces sp. A7024]|uniref:Uncharacterized protein n=1 Tax=Streptomyces coryli TaxID=1128680 RepID=A0A6G4UD18_9ACTN|nr:hypothetical protein [Streptomyces coryli]NGN70064.1 hypothetical protein [Streptomyces coryli]